MGLIKKIMLGCNVIGGLLNSISRLGAAAQANGVDAGSARAEGSHSYITVHRIRV